jgi:hypothetical protein
VGQELKVLARIVGRQTKGAAMKVSLLILAAALALSSPFAVAQQNEDGNGLSLGKSMPGSTSWRSVSRSRSDT